MHSFLDDFGCSVTLTFDPAVYRQRMAKHVLVFPFLDGKLVFTRHHSRGIELPGGKVEPGESSLAAAVRETYEETGCSLSAIEQIGQYVIDGKMVKNIYIARVDRMEQQATGTDVAGAVIFETIPESVKGDPRFSRLLYDDVYTLTLARICSHPFASPG